MGEGSPAGSGGLLRLPDGAREFYRGLADAAADWILELSGDGRVLYTSPSCVELTGYSPASLLGRLAFDFVLDEDRPRIERTFGEALDHSVKSGPQFRLRRRDGELVWFQIRGRRCVTPTGEYRLVLILRDVTDLKELEFNLEHQLEKQMELERQATEELRKRCAELESAHAELRASEDRMRALAEHAPDIISELDAKGRFLYVNPSYERLLGWTPARLVGTNAGALIHPDDRGHGALEFRVLASGAPGSQSTRLRVAHADGDWRWFETVAAPFRSAGGALRILSSGREITSRVHREGQLERADHLARTEEIVGSVAHAIRTPLAALLGTAALLAEQSADSNPLAARLLQLSRRIDRVVTRSLDLTRQGTLQREPVAPAVLLEGIAASCADQARQSGVAVSIRPGSELPHVLVDLPLMHTAIESLVENAIEASARGQAVVLVCEGILDDRALRIAIRDDGCGIPPERSAEILKPFYTTKPKGTGLGIPIASGIVRAHGGTLRIESELAGGTLVTIELPCDDALDKPSLPK